MERPGAKTPWHALNQLLEADECFTLQKGILMAPKQETKLAAILYYLQEQQIPFTIQEKDSHSLFLSLRAFSHIKLLESGVVQVGAGCTLQQLQQALFERGLECALEAPLFTSNKESVASHILAGRSSGLYLSQAMLPEAILGARLVTFKGSQINWGGHLLTPLAGPALHTLLWGLGSLPACLVQFTLKAIPRPAKRIHLSWAFTDLTSLQAHFQALQALAATWERLDYIIAGEKGEKSFICAQLSGLAEEIEAFPLICPLYDQAYQEERRIALKTYLSQPFFHAYRVLKQTLCEKGEYLWHQALSEETWLISRQTHLSQANNWVAPEIPVWKERLYASLKEI